MLQVYVVPQHALARRLTRGIVCIHKHCLLLLAPVNAVAYHPHQVLALLRWLAHVSHNHGHLELNRGFAPGAVKASGLPPSGSSSTPLLTNCPSPQRGSSPVSFASGVEVDLPPASPSSSMQSCTCLQDGFHQKAPPANSTVLRRNLTLSWLQLGPSTTSDVVRKLFSMWRRNRHST